MYMFYNEIRKSHNATLKEIKNSLANEPNTSNIIKSGTAALKVSVAIDALISSYQKITPTTVSFVSGVQRSYLYKNESIKKLIASYDTYNNGLDTEPYNMEHKIKLINYQLHMKLMESYIHQYQLLTFQNEYMEKEIASLKEELKIK